MRGSAFFFGGNPHPLGTTQYVMTAQYYAQAQTVSLCYMHGHDGSYIRCAENLKLKAVKAWTWYHLNPEALTSLWLRALAELGKRRQRSLAKAALEEIDLSAVRSVQDREPRHCRSKSKRGLLSNKWLKQSWVVNKGSCPTSRSLIWFERARCEAGVTRGHRKLYVSLHCTRSEA